MQPRKQLNISGVLQDVAASIEHAVEHNRRCCIVHEVFIQWPPEALGLLESQGVIRKEQSRRLEEISCFCGEGKKLPVRYEERKSKPYAQCFECGDLRPVDIAALEYYETSPLQIASFFTKCIPDINQPRSIVNDNVFFVGETKGSVLVYLACGIKSCDTQEALAKCDKDANGAAFIVISTFMPAEIAKKYTVVPAYEGKLYIADDDGLKLDIDFIEKHFAKKSQQQEAANIKWRNDPKKKAENILEQHLHANINNWQSLNHVEIADHIYNNSNIINYNATNGKPVKLTKEKVKTIVKTYFEEKNQTFRIFGHPSYISDTYQWYS